VINCRLVMLGRQLHKRRLMPAPRPFILDPIPDAPTPTPDGHSPGMYDLNGRRVLPESENLEREELHQNIEALLGLTGFSASQHADDAPPGRRRAGAGAHDSQDEGLSEGHKQQDGSEGLGLQLFALPEAASTAAPKALPQIGDSPRSQRPTVKLGVEEGQEEGIEPIIDPDWHQRTLHFAKPDGRTYRLHQKRLKPPPQPVMAPSVYAKELAPGYTATETARAMPHFKGFANKHDLITFLTTGEPLPGPTLAQMASEAAPLGSRLDEIHDTNVAVQEKVETLWRLKQSWNMQGASNSPWRTPLARPKVLKEAPGRHFRTNINVHDLSAASCAAAEDYEVTNGTMFKKGTEQIDVVGRWSMFQGEPSSQPKTIPEDFNSRVEITKELKRRLPTEEEELDRDVEATVVDVEAAGRMMTKAREDMMQIQIDIEDMKRDLNAVDEGAEGDEQRAELPVLSNSPKPGLSEELGILQQGIETRKERDKKKGTGVIFVGDGKYMEVEQHEGGMDGGGDDDDLEDLIKKPKMKRPTAHRDCFNPLSKQSVHR